MVLTEVGEDTIAFCTSCDYAANLEMAEILPGKPGPALEGNREKQLVHTGDLKTIDEIAGFFNVSSEDVLKTMIYRVDEKYVAVLVRGSDEVNEAKVKNLFNADMIELADAGKVKELTGSPVGTVGPVGLKLAVVADHGVKGAVNVIVGANQAEYHFKNVSEGTDFEVNQFADLRNIKVGDSCPRCGGTIDFARGIEVGHVFKLGTKYSEKLGARYLDEQGREQDMVMGCYGIGVSRTVAAAIEQNHDENGIVWPVPLAPFDVHVVPVNVKETVQVELADSLYRDLQNQGFDPLLDDRAERAGVKFKDSDIIGAPIRLTVGSKAADGIVELKVRKTGETKEIAVSEVLDEVRKSLSELK